MMINKTYVGLYAIAGSIDPVFAGNVSMNTKESRKGRR